jgi:hypothetical protein
MAAFSLGVGGECAPGAGAVLAFDAGIGEAEADDPFVVLQQRSRLAAALAARVGDLAAADVWEWFDGVVGDPVITLLDAGSRPDHPSWEPHLAALWEERRVAWVAMEAAWLATQAPVLALRQWQGCAAVERAFGAWRTAVSPRIAVASAAVEWRSCARVELAFSAWRSAAQLHQLRLQAEADRSRLGFSSEELRAAEAELARRSTESILLGPGRVRACTREELCALELATRCAAQRRASAAAAYEHLKAVAESSMGCDALLDLCMQLVTGHWCPSDRAARLIALVKDVGFRPITMGESRRRRVGRAILQSLGSSVEDVMLPAHQLAFTADGCQIVYNLLRHCLRRATSTCVGCIFRSFICAYFATESLQCVFYYWIVR